jgi:hypothetical protein
MRRNFAAFLLIVIILALNAACVQREQTPTPTPEVVTQRVPLTDRSTAVVTVPASRNDNVLVEVEITQEEDMYAACGNPSVHDAFGNVMAELSPEVHSYSLRIYRFAFDVPADGQYGVFFDSSECAVRQTESTAIVRWTIAKPD